ncbi:MAG: Spx/MgsR family RNA polymerase-binding regulatory protein [Cyanobacteria bacterium J06600_6]
MSIQVYGIPNCGTCKKAIAWLKENDIKYEFINTKDNPPDEKAIASWVEILGSKPMRNTSGKSYRALGDARNNFSDKQWIAAFSQDAMLLKRPIFVKDSQAVLVGFRASEAELKEKLI